MTETKKVARMQYLVVGVVSMLFAGIIYAWSILKAPLAEEFGWSSSQLALNFTITMTFFCLGGVVAGILTKATSPKISTIVGGVLTAAGFILCSRMNGGSVAMLYISYGVMCGAGIGMAYNAVIASTNAWFPDMKGTCSGALMMGFGASTLVLGNLASSLISSTGWRTTYLILGVAIGVILLLTGFVVKFPGEDVVLPQPKAAAGGAKEDFEPRDYTTGEMVRRFSFWRFFAFNILLSAVGNTVISCARDVAMVGLGATAALGTSLVGVLSVCNGLGRIMCGTLFDRIGRANTMKLAGIITIAAPAITLVAMFMHSIPVGVIGLCLTGVSYGCGPSLNSATIGSFYGMKNFSGNFSIANMNLIFASFIATASASLYTSTGSFVAPYILLLVLAVVSMALNLSIKRP